MKEDEKEQKKSDFLSFLYAIMLGKIVSVK